MSTGINVCWRWPAVGCGLKSAIPNRGVQTVAECEVLTCELAFVMAPSIIIYLKNASNVPKLGPLPISPKGFKF